jgi:hypothetical protein
MLREMYSYWRDKKPTDTFREFHEEVKNDWDELYPSLLDEILTIDEYIEGNYLRHDGKLWSSEYYCETLEGTFSHIDDTYWCYYMGEPSDETFTVYIGRSEHRYSNRGIEKHGSLYEYRGDYYDHEALSRHDLVIMYDGEIEHRDNAYQHEDGEYYYEPEEEESYTRDYHHNTHQEKVIFSKAPQFFIGIEVEKEDQDVKESISIDYFESECPGYRKENDGSLDDESGFEMITPPYELVPDKIMEHIKANKVLVDHFNAATSYSCGGHVNLSEEGITGDELFAKLKGYTPLFHALYHKRITNKWSKGKSNRDLQSEKEKYQSIRIHGNRIEYRLISAVHNLDTLEWRLKLFELITKYPASCPKVAYFFFQTKLKRHIKKMYPKNFEELNKRVIAMTYEYENINL